MEKYVPKEPVEQPLAKWCIVLLAGKTPPRPEKTRLRGRLDNDRAASGRGENLRANLDASLERASFFAGDQNTILSMPVSQSHRLKSVAVSPRLEVSIRPNRLGTGAALLMGLLKVTESNRDALVCVMPEYGQVPDERRLVAQIRRAAIWAERNPKDIVVIGARPCRPEPQRWWILGGRQAHAHIWPRRAQLIAPKTPEEAEKLMDRGLLSLGIAVFRVRTMLELYRRSVPALHANLFKLRTGGWDFLSNVFAFDYDLDLWDNVLQRSTCRLRVLPVPNLVIKRGLFGPNVENVHQPVARANARPAAEMHTSPVPKQSRPAPEPNP